VFCPVFGYFTSAKNILNTNEFGGARHQGNSDKRVSYMPTFDVMNSNKLEYKAQPPISLPAMTPEEIRLRKVYDCDKIVKVDFSLIAMAA
jgi:hypothetical protein